MFHTTISPDVIQANAEKTWLRLRHVHVASGASSGAPLRANRDLSHVSRPLASSPIGSVVESLASEESAIFVQLGERPAI